MELHEMAERLLFGDRLEDKLYFADSWTDSQSHPALAIPSRPGRPPALDFLKRTERTLFPKETELYDERQRGVVLHFFANHELLAIEIMALAILRFPDAPISFRAGLAQTIAEEQKHLRLYTERMQNFGVELGAVPVNKFFWDCLREMNDPLDFVIGMSMTFEQANLDFARYYRDAFQKISDHQTAAILQQVYEDEIGHVKHGVTWFDRWKEPDESQWQGYQKRLKLPLSPARAKGPIFDWEARNRARLGQEYCEQLDVFAGSKGGKLPSLLWYNADCELELAREGKNYNPTQGTRNVLGELMGCMMFVAKAGDVVLVQQLPSAIWLQKMRQIGFDLPEFWAQPTAKSELRKSIATRRWDKMLPWGWTPRSVDMAKDVLGEQQSELPIDLSREGFAKNPWMSTFRKSALPGLRAELRAFMGDDSSRVWGPAAADGVLIENRQEVLPIIESMWTQFQRPVVIKSPYGFAGAGMLRAYPEQSLSKSQWGWIEKQLELYGAVVLEPWLERIADLSVVWQDEVETPQTFLFTTNAKGQYKGHSLQPISYALTPELRTLMFATRNGQRAWSHRLLEIAGFIRKRLSEQGYRYAAGIDTMLYRWQDCIYLRILGEVNCRMTMGHIAGGLRKYIAAHEPSSWQSITAAEAKDLGWASLGDMAASLEAQHPLVMKHNVVEQGVFFSNDPSQSQYILGVVAVGAAAVGACTVTTVSTAD